MTKYEFCYLMEAKPYEVEEALSILGSNIIDVDATKLALCLIAIRFKRLRTLRIGSNPPEDQL